MGRQRKKKLPEGNFIAEIRDLSDDGRGVATVDGKTVFISNALPGEQVEFSYTYSKSNFAEGKANVILSASADRIEPKCEYFNTCGGCSFQHVSHSAQIEHKQAILIKQLQHFGKVDLPELLPPVTGQQWGYRNKARLSVRNVPKKGDTLVGFREKRSNFVTDMQSCCVLNPCIGEHINDLRQLISQLSIPAEIAQIEVAIGDNVNALIFRHLKPLSDNDIQLLKQFGTQYQFEIYLQPKGPDTVHHIDSNDCPLLSYRLPNYNLELLFHPSDFTQVNSSINTQLVDLVIKLLAIEESDHILDLFCGLGNFTLPMATKAAQVIGVEGSKVMTERASLNAKHNQLNNVSFYACDLSQNFTAEPWMTNSYNKLLIDPPRSGALEVVQSIKNLDNIEHIVYVSCNPATLARDVGELVNNQGFKLETAGILDMFPQTNHVESIAVLKK